MISDVIILPGPGRWQPAGLTEGALDQAHSFGPRGPSTTPLRVAVPLPVPGRI